MGLVYAEIELINCEDQLLAKKHYIGEEEIKKITVSALVDSGAYMLAINENVQQQLQLPVIERKKLRLANEELVEYDRVGPVELRFKNLGCICSALVLPGDAEVLLGSIPLEELDVLIDPARQKLIVHPDHNDRPYLSYTTLKPLRKNGNDV